MSSAISSICWIPGSETEFFVTFECGKVLSFDKDREDKAIDVNAESSDIIIRKFGRSDKFNPVSMWNTHGAKPSSLSFSFDCNSFAMTTKRGEIIILDYAAERITDIFHGYFGGITCLSWSPDGKYFITGGEDDLVTIWSFSNKKIIARCHGHSSFVSSVSFDKRNCDGNSISFVSVGFDGNLIFWKFTEHLLHRPRSLSLLKRELLAISLDAERIDHPVLERDKVPTLEPTFVIKICDFPLSSVSFDEDIIAISTKTGQVKLFKKEE